MGLEWKINPLNFETAYDGLLTLLVLSSLDGWRELLSVAMNANIQEIGPTRDNMKYTAYIYFISFIIVGIWFFLKLVLGVVFFNFLKSQKKRNVPYLNENEIKWLQIQRMILGAKPLLHPPPKTRGMSYRAYKFLKSTKYEKLVTSVLIANLLILMFKSESMGETWGSIINALLIFLGSLYILEMLIKIFCFGVRGYFHFHSFRLESLIVVFFIFDQVLLSKLQKVNDDSSSAEGEIFKIFSIFRVLRVLPIIRLIRNLGFLKQLIKTIEFGAPMALQLTIVLLIITFFFSVLGCILFEGVTEGKIIDEYTNFRNMFYGMMTLLKCSTTDHWSDIMVDLDRKQKECIGNNSCGSGERL